MSLYIEGANGIDACPNGYEAIQDKTVCKLASKSLGLTYSEARNDNKPNAICKLCGGCTPQETRMSEDHGQNTKWICRKSKNLEIL